MHPTLRVLHASMTRTCTCAGVHALLLPGLEPRPASLFFLPKEPQELPN
jgi:hypothetical protein